MKKAIALYCRELKLGGGLVESISKIEASTHEEFLLKLFEIEVLKRKATRKTKLLKNAKFDMIKTFVDYEFFYFENLPESIQKKFDNSIEELMYYLDL